MRKKMLVVLMLSVSFAPSVFANGQESNRISQDEVKAGEHNRPSEFPKGSVTCRFERDLDASEKSESSHEQGTAGSAR